MNFSFFFYFYLRDILSYNSQLFGRVMNPCLNAVSLSLFLLSYLFRPQSICSIFLLLLSLGGAQQKSLLPLLVCVPSFLKACHCMVGAWCRGTSTGHSNNPSLILYFLGVLFVCGGYLHSASGQRLFCCLMLIC